MTWHHDHPHTEGVMEHPRDGEAWKHLDTAFPMFASEPCNVSMRLCADCFANLHIMDKAIHVDWSLSHLTIYLHGCV